MMIGPHDEWCLDNVLDYIEDSQPSPATTVQEKPIRCLKRGTEDDDLYLETFQAQKYVTVSYTWPAKSWSRIYDSNLPTKVWHGAVCNTSQHISMFMLHVFDHILSGPLNQDRQNLYFWIDHPCIRQDDEEEKQRQIATMDRIYSGASLTAILLEDVELTAEEYYFLRLRHHSVGQERERFLSLLRKVLKARWFGRAWCSQEFLLSRWASFYVHQTGKSREPIAFGLQSLAAWVSDARVYDATIPFLPEQRGIASLSQPVKGIMYVGSFAWAYGVVSLMGCFNVFDKVALVLNLVRTPTGKRLTAFPSSEGSSTATADLNVAKIVNVLAIQNKDFSLLQTGHQPDNPFPGVDGFGWASLPAKGDLSADGWRHQIYEVDKDPAASVTAAGLRVRGLSEQIVDQRDWRIQRCGNDLHISVDGKQKVVQYEWLKHAAHEFTEADRNAYEREPPLARLRDILYGIEAFGAAEVWPAFMPVDDTWTVRTQDDGKRSYNESSLRSRIIKEYIRPGTMHRTMATGCSFLHRSDGTTRFSEVTLSSGFRMVVSGNVADMRGCEIFQPFVMRMHIFGAHSMTCSAFLLRGAPSPQAQDVRRVEGHVRSFQLVPGDVEVKTYTLR